MNYLIGHLIGDYILQNDWMAQHKKKNWFRCIVHCAIYTVSVCVFTGWWDYRAILVFLSHIIFDKTTIAYDWMDFFGTFKEIRKESISHWLWAYAVVDNTFHLTCLFLINLLRV